MVHFGKVLLWLLTGLIVNRKLVKSGNRNRQLSQLTSWCDSGSNRVRGTFTQSITVRQEFPEFIFPCVLCVTERKRIFWVWTQGGHRLECKNVSFSLDFVYSKGTLLRICEGSMFRIRTYYSDRGDGTRLNTGEFQVYNFRSSNHGVLH